MTSNRSLLRDPDFGAVSGNQLMRKEAVFTPCLMPFTGNNLIDWTSTHSVQVDKRKIDTIQSHYRKTNIGILVN